VTASSFQRLRGFATALALAFYALFIARTSFMAPLIGGGAKVRTFVLFEDAMISMRYARNFARGAGLNWNAGEERVEGYTNLLWTLWMSLMHKLPLDASKVSLPMMVTGVVILLTLAWVTKRIALRVGGSEGAATASYLGVLFCYPLIFWSLRGMEVGAVSLALHSVILLAMELETSFSIAGAIGLGMLGAAAVLLRSDSAVTIGLVCVYAAIMQPKRRVQTLILCFAPVALAAIGHTVFRRIYYHETLPNTAHLKLANIPAIVRIKRGLFVALRVYGYHLGLPLSLLAASLACSSRPQGNRAGWLSAFQDDDPFRRRFLLGVLISVQVAYSVYVGGDAWEWMLYANRYTSAALPALIALIPAIFEGVAKEERLARRWAVSLLLIGIMLLALDTYARFSPEEGVARTIFSSKKILGGGALFIASAVGLLIKRASVGLWLAKFAKSLQDKPRASLLLFTVVFVPCQLEPLLVWAKNNAAQYHDEEGYARLGMLIKAATPPDFRIAVVAAGATPYFADRPTEDMLGKNDKVIAKQSPKGVFSPGHDKWDYTHSLGDKKPDMVVEFADFTEGDRVLVKELGFVKFKNGLTFKEPAVKAYSPALKMLTESAVSMTEDELDEALDASTHVSRPSAFPGPQ
jgi:arabinofuranosyltransferase